MQLRAAGLAAALLYYLGLGPITSTSIARLLALFFFLLGASSVSFPAREGFGGVRVGDRLFREHESEAIGCCLSCVTMNMLAGVDSVSPCVFRLHQYSSNLFAILPSSHLMLDLIKETSTCVHQKIESGYVRWKKRGV